MLKNLNIRTQFGGLGVPRIPFQLNRPDYRLPNAVQQFIKSVHDVAFVVQTEIGFYVLFKRPDPVSLPLPGVCALPPYAVSDPMTYPLDYDLYRRMVPRPVSEGPYRVHTAAIGADVTLQANSAAVSVKIRIDKSVAPYPTAFTVLSLAD